jgi:hypothetical protein
VDHGPGRLRADTALVEHLAAAPPTADQLRSLRAELAVHRRILADGGTLALGTDAPLVPFGLSLHLGLRALRDSTEPAVYRNRPAG